MLQAPLPHPAFLLLHLRRAAEGRRRPPMAFAPASGGNYKTQFNGVAGSSSLCFLASGPTALAPEVGVQLGRREDGARHVLCPRVRRAAPARSLLAQG